jgi:hypothetical protein
MRRLHITIGILGALISAGCSTKTGAIDSCSYEVEKLMLPWVKPDGTVPDSLSYDLRKAELLNLCITSKGYVFNTVRANAEYQAGRSPGLVGHYKEPKNWSFGWFGLVSEKTEPVAPAKVLNWNDLPKK